MDQGRSKEALRMAIEGIFTPRIKIPRWCDNIALLQLNGKHKHPALPICNISEEWK